MLHLYPSSEPGGRRRGIDFRRRDEGFTLIELIIVIAIMGIALAGIYTLLIWGYTTFNSGTEKIDIHYHLNLASELLTDEVRYATSLELLDDWDNLPAGPEEVMAGEHYIYYDQQEQALVMLDQNRNREIGDPFIASVTFSLTGNLFDYDLEASYRKSKFELGSTVELLNIKNPISPEGDPIPAIRYTKP